MVRDPAPPDVARLTPVKLSAKDRPILAAAIAARASHFVTGDRLVRRGMVADCYSFGLDTPYRLEILIATAVGQEGIDPRPQCRHVIHHDLCWNLAVIEQRTVSVDQTGKQG